MMNSKAPHGPRSPFLLSAVAAIGAPLWLLLSGFTFDEVTYVYRDGVSVYNDLSRADPIQIIAFEKGIPERLGNVTVNGIPVASFQPAVLNSSPILRDHRGNVQALTWRWSERYDIRFSVKSVQFRLPLSDFQRLQVLGRPRHMDRIKRPKGNVQRPEDGDRWDGMDADKP